MLYAISHCTMYSYESAVSVSMHRLHLRPRELSTQVLMEFSLEIEPAPAEETEELDYYGNPATFLAVESPHRTFTVTAHSKVRVAAPSLPEPADTIPWETAQERCASDTLTADSEAGEFLFDSPQIIRAPDFADYAAPSFTPGRPIMDAVIDLVARIYDDFKFDRRATNVATPVSEVLRKRRGVCQDFAHLAICCLRSIGLPARYVSGYIETSPPPGTQRLIGADASHAWFAFWCPDFGWIAADPTNDTLAGRRHITVAWGRDFSDVSPVQGVVVGGGRHGLGVGIDVSPLEEEPDQSARKPASSATNSDNGDDEFPDDFNPA
jgi:transglutaminase-like putative cysteine protease